MENHRKILQKITQRIMQLQVWHLCQFTQKPVEEESLAWWIDNGATRHATNCSHYFLDFQKFKEPCCVKAAGTETLTALGKGSIRFSSIGHQEITLNNVLYAPKSLETRFQFWLLGTEILTASLHHQLQNVHLKSMVNSCCMEQEDYIEHCLRQLSNLFYPNE